MTWPQLEAKFFYLILAQDSTPNVDVSQFAHKCIFWLKTSTLLILVLANNPRSASSDSYGTDDVYVRQWTIYVYLQLSAWFQGETNMMSVTVH